MTQKQPTNKKWKLGESYKRSQENASPVRLRNRCSLTGRPRGVYSKFGIARGKLRDLIMHGDVPGVIKACW